MSKIRFVITAVLLLFLFHAFGRIYLVFSHVYEPPPPSKEIQNLLKSVYFVASWSETRYSPALHYLNGLGTTEHTIFDPHPFRPNAETNGEEFTDGDLSEDNRTLALREKNILDWNACDIQELYVGDARSSGSAQVINVQMIYASHCGTIYSPRWSPDNRRIAFLEHIDDATDLVVLDERYSMEKRVRLCDQCPVGGFLAWLTQTKLAIDLSLRHPSAYTFQDKILTLDLPSLHKEVLCEGLSESKIGSDWSEVNERCPDSEGISLLFGDPKRRALQPIFSADQRFYFYFNRHEDPLVYKRWIEGYDRQTGEIFHVLTTKWLFPYLP